ncbi:MFS transporter [Bradyrhizobium sp. KB893862 SZCCT0404]|uniref:MFS transporter n=1 Tax=Bradyrhizobium sp. KB893862 SZCCT0404 TaxID=2807672 RepID=UPI001BA817BA|nr:MFS transporter [Bradyrhizobium sp. KB893862 SZCCT0404]MBR1177160.1 MFS transporter [Bradyrhizobium sp. KB893862 SZCCT0404]
MTTQVLETTTQPVIDIGVLAEEGVWSTSRKQVLLLCALAIILDGLDNQILGFAIPSLIKEWNVTRGDFAPALALGFVGMTIGTPIGGLVGDWLGRKVALIASVFLFGAATLAIAGAHGVNEVSLCRFLAGLGLGGALPGATALIAEFTPKRNRSLSVMLGIVCIPIGGMIGGVLAAQLLPEYGWRILFAISGALPMIVAVLLAIKLPESPQYLLARGADTKKVARSVRILDHTAAESSVFVDRRAVGVERASVGALFIASLRRTTVALWIAFFFCLLPVYVLYAWAPTLLTSKGFDLQTASFGLALFNFGGVAGCVVTGWTIGRYGTRIAILAVAGAAAVGAAILAGMPLSTETKPLLMALLCIEGFCLLGAQGSLYALAAHVYPTNVRSTGVGAAAGFGRAGAIVSAYVGTFALNYGTTAFFTVIAACVVVTFIAVAIVDLHQPPVRAEP